VTSADPDHLARDAYEAYRAVRPTPLPPWEDVSEQEQAAWKAAMSAIAGQRKVTRATASQPGQSPMAAPITLLDREGDCALTAGAAGRRGRHAAGLDNLAT